MPIERTASASAQSLHGQSCSVAGSIWRRRSGPYQPRHQHRLLPCRPAGDGGASASLHFLTGRSAGRAIAPTTTSARGATRVGHPIASSIHPRR